MSVGKTGGHGQIDSNTANWMQFSQRIEIVFTLHTRTSIKSSSVVIKCREIDTHGFNIALLLSASRADWILSSLFSFVNKPFSNVIRFPFSDNSFQGEAMSIQGSVGL